VEMTSRLTKRAVAAVLLALSQKLHEMVNAVISDSHSSTAVKEALEHPQTKEVVQKHILAKGIRMTDPNQNNKSIYKAQMGLIGEFGEHAVNESPKSLN